MLASPRVNTAQKATLERVFADPVNGNLAWSRIESLLRAIGCNVIAGKGSAVTFEHGGRKLTLHRPHPGKEALRYRVIAVREFLDRIGVAP
jgi:predicted RNA binding protein YcfA (HicA-like mRNA interferase family)